jgi:hypothetical protein
LTCSVVFALTRRIGIAKLQQTVERLQQSLDQDQQPDAMSEQRHQAELAKFEGRSLKPAQKITRVRGNQVGISYLVGTFLFSPNSLFSYRPHIYSTASN